jgi:uncharacterized protein (TIGR03085 family)
MNFSWRHQPRADTRIDLVAKPNFARTERSSLADLLDDIGPDQPTLCEGWQTRDLAAHVVVRDRRPDAAVGVLIKRFAGHTDRIRNAAAKQPWDVLIGQLRTPPRVSLAGVPALDRVTNTSELFVHHEDVRRGQPDWTPRSLDPGLADALRAQLGMTAKMSLRRFPAKITINIPGYGEPIITGAGGPELDVSGEPGELTMFLFGRQRAARVNIVGPDDLVNQLQSKKLGF